MPETFAYDAISFLRVVYMRRFFIIKGAFCATAIAIIASLLWPQTWRANASVFVSTPKFKQSLMLFPEQSFDVKTYEGIMLSDSLYFEIISNVRWMHASTHALLDDPGNRSRLQENLREKAARLTQFELVQNTNQPLLSELLGDGELAGTEEFAKRINLLGNLDAAEIEDIYIRSQSEIEDWSVHSLRRNLGASVAVVKETNLETIYSNSIHLSAEASTAVGSKLLANLWIKLFMLRAENTVRSIMQNQIQFAKTRAADMEITLASAESTLQTFLKDSPIESLESELASLRAALTGMAEQRLKTSQTEEDFNLDDDNESFMNQKFRANENTYFTITPSFENALIPKLVSLKREAAFLRKLIETSTDNAQKFQASVDELNKNISAMEAQINDLQAEINAKQKTLQENRATRIALERKHEQALAQWQSMQGLLAEVALLETKSGQMRFADVSPDYAITPDKRIWPRRSLMTLAGGAFGLLLFIGLAFFLDIWNEVVKPDDPQSNQT